MSSGPSSIQEYPATRKPAERAVVACAIVGLVSSALQVLRGEYVPHAPILCGAARPVSLHSVLRFEGEAGFFAAASLWFVLILVVATSPGVARQDRHAYVFCLSIPALGVGARMVVDTYRHANTLSVPLLIGTAAVGVTFIAAAASNMIPLRRIPAALKKDLHAMVTTKGGFASLVGIVLTSGLLFTGIGRGRLADRENRGEARKAFVSWFTGQGRVDSPILNGEHEGQIIFARFTDYQCPACRVSFDEYGPLLAKYQKRHGSLVRLLTYDFPLDADCNPQIKTPVHGKACEAAVAVRVARRARKDAAGLEEWLFANQASLSTPLIWDAARRLASVKLAANDYESAREDVRNDIRFGIKLGVTSTPTFFINGVRLQGMVPADQLEAVLEEEDRRITLKHSR